MPQKLIYALALSLLTFLFTACAFAQEQPKPIADNGNNKEIKNATRQIDLKNYFEGFNGTAIFYNPAKEKYTVYNKELSEKQSSPCSTFKIFSTYVGILTDSIDPQNSLRRWSGTTYWMDEWNRDTDLENAVKYSCVRYFRRVVNDIGPEAMQKYIDEYNYGNKDISDWNGTINTNETNPDLIGFWIESSLKISPKEQTQVLYKIFTDLKQTDNHAVENEMKRVFLVYEDKEKNLKIYGKTGFGRVNGENTDAWFVGMYELGGKENYFAIRLDDPKKPESTSAKAKEIALNIIKEKAADLF